VFIQVVEHRQGKNRRKAEAAGVVTVAPTDRLTSVSDLKRFFDSSRHEKCFRQQVATVLPGVQKTNHLGERIVRRVNRKHAVRAFEYESRVAELISGLTQAPGGPQLKSPQPHVVRRDCIEGFTRRRCGGFPFGALQQTFNP